MAAKMYTAILEQRISDWAEASNFRAALYTNVPMSVRTSAGLSPCFQAVTGLSQGCPLSPTLFGLDIDNLEEELMAR
ncbi:hypothetical protein CHLNCDRAFT_139057 [Chlorella variabilis]|uniref:Reverse transcriptase domain-containing protein n=1 Tax=Chlorella variabilis TaxID=554065 RepID=E1ZP95_CHLVA|nr:hypothetical protein CHLNCDRAFT_139057 [Chlorella variabilis]EFN52213.1 hypothetical protein CHLNCDRAFT_139057 [Chlorella variabilis]|eukprot:XP_005844315.1 hypothetical protein CHLNCDRAFT_139057 [Chlorella variabilis]